MKKHILLLLIFISSVACAQETYTFKFQWKKGQKFKFESTTEQTIKMEWAGNNEQTINIDYSIFIDEVLPSGNYKCSVLYDKMQMISTAYADMGMQDVITTAMDNLVGLGFKAEMTPDGRCAGVENVGDLLRDFAFRMFPGNTPGDKFKRDEFMDKMKVQYNDSTLKAEFDNIGGGYAPIGPVKINDTWTRTVTQKLLVDKKSIYVYKLDTVTGNIATISFTSKEEADGDLKALSALDAKTDLKVTGEGTFKVNILTGLISEGHNYIHAKGTISTMGKDDKTEIDSESTIKQSEVK